MNRLLFALMLCCLVPSRAIAEDTAESTVSLTAPSWELIDFRSKTHRSVDFAGEVHVVAFLGTECPLAKLYAGRLEQLRQDFAAKGVRFVAVDANEQDSLAELAAFADRQGIEYPLLKDPDAAVARGFGATRTPEVFLVDARGVVRYRGRIDDQYVIGIVRQKPEHQELRDAIEQVLAGRPVTVSRTEAMGCLIGQRREEVAPTELTYSRDVAAILQRRCVDCHRAGDVGPMQLDNYADAAAWGEMIVEVVQQRRMPPWHADPAVGHWANDRSLPEQERDALISWVEGGCPEGDPAETPPAKSYTEGWQLPRQPDAVFAMREEPYKVPATGEVEYKYFSVDPGFTEDRWVRAAEIQPGNRMVVHHVLVFAVLPGEEKKLGGARSYLTGYVPGTRAKPFPDGMAKKIEAGSRLIFQVHYTPVGTEQSDLSRIGFLFADPDEITHEVKTTSVVQPRLDIPPGEGDYRVEAMLPERLPECEILSLSPHMHLRGKSFRYELVTTANERVPLLNVPEYDFNWQTAYEPAGRLKIAEGSRVYCAASYDNSDENIYNPDPNQRVRWGDQTDDEMMIGYFDYAVKR